MENFIIVAVILLIIGGAVAYIIKEKKKRCGLCGMSPCRRMRKKASGRL